MFLRTNTTEVAHACVPVGNAFRWLGVPQTILSDRGPQFRAEGWHQILDLLGTTVTHSAPHTPHSHGDVDRRTESSMKCCTLCCIAICGSATALERVCQTDSVRSEKRVGHCMSPYWSLYESTSSVLWATYTGACLASHTTDILGFSNLFYHSAFAYSRRLIRAGKADSS